jgi:hypothetical protein
MTKCLKCNKEFEDKYFKEFKRELPTTERIYCSDCIDKLWNKKNQIWWKVIIILTFILSLTSTSIFIYNNLPKYEYDVMIIQLDNNNFGENIWVVDYLCDDGIEVNNIQFNNILLTHHWFYASAWIDADINKGKCAIKVKRRIE